MSKAEILEYFNDINVAYNNCGMHDSLSNMLTEFEQEIRAKAIDEAIKASAKAICVGCGYLDGYKCTYKGSNCGVSKPMLESVTKALEELKGGGE